MNLVDSMILVASLLLIFSITSSKLTSRLGMPLIVLFIIVGMLAGSEGLGQITFENYELTYGITTIALGFILFDGGLQTNLKSVKATWRPAGLLATFGVLFTAGLTGAAVHYIVGFGWYEAMLIGAIVGSTDAAAVFSLFRGSAIKPHISSLLEVESGSNDPMAIFLTLGLVQIISGQIEPNTDILWLLIEQLGLGTILGIVGGKVAAWIINRINLNAAGLYPVLTVGLGFAVFGVTAALNGSGFLAIYIAGIVIGDHPKLVFKRGIFVFSDGMAWLFQVVLFVVLGLLSTPSNVWAKAEEGLAVAFLLVFIARPLSVLLLLVPFFKYSKKELLFISWVGLKGAVPVSLAIYPLIYGIPGGIDFFNVIFFVVLISALAHGLTIPWLAEKLDLIDHDHIEPPLSLEVTSIKAIGGDILGFTLRPDSHLAGRFIRDLHLPDGAVVAVMARDETLLPPRSNTRLRIGDHLFLAVQDELRCVVDRLFAGEGKLQLPPFGLYLSGSAKLNDLESLYGLRLGYPCGPDELRERDLTLDQFVREKLQEKEISPGMRVTCKHYELEVVEVKANRLKRAHLLPLHDAETHKEEPRKVARVLAAGAEGLLKKRR